MRQKIIKNTANRIYINKILLYRRSRARPIGATRPGGHIQTGYVARLSCAIPYGMTSPGPPVQTGYVA
jgi:hypothetical protein